MKIRLMTTVALVASVSMVPSALASSTQEAISNSIQASIADRVSQGVVSDTGSGGGAGQSSIWGQVLLTDVDLDAASGDSSSYTGILGGDNFFTDRFLLGLVGAASSTDTDGAPEDSSTSATPYAAYILSKSDKSATFLIGTVGFGSNDDSSFVSSSLSLNYVKRNEKTRIRLGAGVNFTSTDMDAGGSTEANGVNVNGEVGFPSGNHTPYLGLNYAVSYPDVGPSSDTLNASAGLRWEVSATGTLTIEGQYELLTEDTDTITGLIGYRSRF